MKLPFLRPSHLALLLAACAFHLGCGGKVIVDGASGAGGSTGAGGTGGTNMTSSVATTGTGTSDTCEALRQAYEMALAAARQCNACIDFDGCMTGPTFTDTCGCPIVLNSGASDLVAAAKVADSDWISAGCQPLACGKPCFAGTGWSCHPSAGGDCNGTCQPN
ncbi:MAG: hypothetical protein U0359_02810 [Byssovorax sp.]